MIAVDEKKLAEALGFKHLNHQLITDRERMAARAITDSRWQDSPDVALSNAVCWINMAYEEGRRDGGLAERRNWQEKIGRIFDVPVEKP